MFREKMYLEDALKRQLVRISNFLSRANWASWAVSGCVAAKLPIGNGVTKIGNGVTKIGNGVTKNAWDGALERACDPSSRIFLKKTPLGAGHSLSLLLKIFWA